jgi:uncharacterized protein YfiM (DUF2279 family)
MEFASGGDMFEYVVKKNGLREEEARWFFQQLIVGLDYCHRMVRAGTSAAAATAAGEQQHAVQQAAAAAVSAAGAQYGRCGTAVQLHSQQGCTLSSSVLGCSRPSAASVLTFHPQRSSSSHSLAATADRP